MTNDEKIMECVNCAEAGEPGAVYPAGGVIEKLQREVDELRQALAARGTCEGASHHHVHACCGCHHHLTWWQTSTAASYQNTYTMNPATMRWMPS